MRRTKILAAMLSLVFVFMLFPSLRVNADASGTCGDNLTWVYVNSTKTLTISGSGAMADYVSVFDVPWVVYDDIKTVVIDNGVTSIGEKAFIGSFRLTSVTIPNSVTSIGRYAFGDCSSLTSITIPNSVTSIGEYAFCNSELTSITIPNSVTSIDKNTFIGSRKLTSITIPDSVTSIGDNAFMYCESLESITIPNSVTSIGECAFSHCDNLKSVTMDYSLKDQCKTKNVFYDCPSNITIKYFEYAITYTSDTNGTVSGTTTTSISGETIIPTVSPNSGYVVKEVTYTNIENTPVPITPDASGNYSFTMPSSNTTVSATFMPGGNCGANGDNVKWTLDDAGTLTISGTGDMVDCFSYDPFSVIYQDIKTVIVNDGVTSIGDGAFRYCTSLASITIPDGVTSIGDSAFLGCTSLTGITIPDSVTSIGDGAFRYCTSLASITIPDGVTSIGNGAFEGCTSLTSITIPDSVQDIGNNAFLDCDKLQTTDNSINIDKALYDANKSAFPSFPDSSFNFTKYTITYTSDGNGSVNGADESASTDKITLTITPNANYVIDTVTYTDNGTEKTINKDANGNYSFEMPSGDTTVNATFKPTYEIQFVNTDGTVLQSSSVPYGDTPVCTITPTQAATAQYTYTFAGWDPAITTVTADATYTATYSTTTNEYTVTFTDADGNQLQSGKLPYGTVPAYNGTPTKAETDKYTYTFSGWKSGNSTYGASSTLPQVTGDATYTAVFTETAKSTTPAPGTYYVQSIEEKDGAIVITIKRTENDDQTYELVQSIETDGKQLTVGDQIELTSGSAIITIKKDYVSTLTPGTHSMKVTFKDGGSITLEYTVKEPEKAAAQAVQATGEATAITAFVGAGLIITACGVVILAIRKRRKEA